MDIREFPKYIVNGALILSLALASQGCKNRRLDNVIYEDAVFYKKEISGAKENFVQGLKATDPVMGKAFELQDYNVTIIGKNFIFELNNKELYNKFENEDTIKVGYKINNKNGNLRFVSAENK